MNLSLSSLVSPKLALTMVRGVIETHVKHNVFDFDMIYNNQEQKIDIKVFFPDGKDLPFGYSTTDRHRLYKYDDSKSLCAMIHTMLKQKITTGDVIDYAIIKYRKDGNENSVDIYYKNNKEENIKETIKL